jgi:hypothetical protein
MAVEARPLKNEYDLVMEKVLLIDPLYVICVDGVDCTFELLPKQWSAWDEALASGMSYDEVARYYEDHKDFTTIMFAGSQETLRITLNLPPDPAAKFKTIELPRKGVNSERMTVGRATFDDAKKYRPLLVVAGEWAETSLEDKTKIERDTRRREQVGVGTQHQELKNVQQNPPTELEKTEIVDARGACVITAEAGINDDAGSVASRMEVKDGATAVSGIYRLEVGKLTVHDPHWDKIEFEGKIEYLSPQIIRIFKAMHELGAVNRETAQTKQRILTNAGLATGRSLSNVFSGGGNKQALFRRVYNKCINKLKSGQEHRYYLD